MPSPPPSAACAPGDEALDRLVLRHQRSVQRFLRALGADAARADDLAQDTFVLAWQKGLLAAEDHATAAWLLRTARNLWLREVRFRRRRVAREAIAIERLWLQRCTQDGGDCFLEALTACRQALAPHATLALTLFYEQGLSREATASRLGLLPNGLKTLLQRVRQVLRQCITQRLGAAGPGRRDDAK